MCAGLDLDGDALAWAGRGSEGTGQLARFGCVSWFSKLLAFRADYEYHSLRINKIDHRSRVAWGAGKGICKYLPL